MAVVMEAWKSNGTAWGEIDGAADRALVLNAARRCVEAVKPADLPLFERTSSEYFRHRRFQRRPDVTGSGIGQTVASVTDAALAAGGATVTLMLALAADRLGGKAFAVARPWWRRLRRSRASAKEIAELARESSVARLEWSPAELARIHETALRAAMDVHRASPGQQDVSRLIADTLVAHLVLRDSAGSTATGGDVE